MKYKIKNSNRVNESKERKIGVILSYLSIILSTIIQLVYTPFMISKMGQSEYGLYSLVSSIIVYLTVLDLGFGNAIVVFTAKFREVNDEKKEKIMLGMFKIIFYIIAVFTLFIGVIIYLNVDNLFGNTLSSIELTKLRIMTLILLFNIFITFSFNIYTSIINAYEKFIFQKVLSIINIVLKPIFMIPLLFLGYKSITMCFVITFVNIIVVLLNYFYCKLNLKVKIRYCGFDKKIFFEIFNYSFYIFLAVIVDKINWSVDQFILGIVSGTVAVSIYSIATQINTLFISLSTAVSGILLPKISKMVAINATNSELTEEFIKVGRIQYYIVFLMVSGLILFGKNFFIAWVGPDFIEAYYIALLLIIPLCVPLIQNLGISIMQAKNLHKFRSVLYLAIAIINVLISIPLSRLFGGVGSAIGTAISLILGNGIIINIYYKNKVGINISLFWKQILKISIPNIIPITIIFILMSIIHLQGYANFIIFGSIYTVIYLVTIYTFSMNNYEKNLVNTVLKKRRLAR